MKSRRVELTPKPQQMANNLQRHEITMAAKCGSWGTVWRTSLSPGLQVVGQHGPAAMRGAPCCTRGGAKGVKCDQLNTVGH